MTSPIHSIARSLQLLRTELGELRDRSKRDNTTRASVATGMSEVPQRRGSAVSRLPSKLKAIRAADGEVAQGIVLRAFVEAALLDEFGDEQQLDPAFAELVEKTCKALEANPSSAALMQDALGELETLLGP